MSQKQEFQLAIEQIAAEKNIPLESIVQTIEAALAAAYRKDFGQPDENIKVKFDVKTGGSKVFDVKTVVDKIPEDPEEQKEAEINPRENITLGEAKKIKKDAKLGDVITTELQPPENYGRIAAQTAKQVIIQRLREAEREIVSREFRGKEGEIINGAVQRIEGRNVYVDLAQATGVLYPHEQIPGETYTVGMRLKVFVSEVRESSKGPEIILSRSQPKFVAKLFELEVPEIYSGVVEIKAIAREAGSRTKLAVWTDQEGVDAVGSAVGQRGTRVQTVIAELGGEKIDVVEYSDDPDTFLRNAMSPAKILKVELNEAEKHAKILVDDDQLSLAIGKGGQNVRLAARLTGWKIDIVGTSEESKKTEKKDDGEGEEKKDDVDKEKDNGEGKKTEKVDEKKESVTDDKVKENKKTPPESEDKSKKDDKNKKEADTSSKK